MDSSREYKYSVLKLIEAVKSRPVLWDNSRPEFRSHKNKDLVWQDVFEELDDNYRFLGPKERNLIACKITTKWKYIRDVFIRSIKKRANDTKIKKYMYHDHLTFMLKLYKPYMRPDSPDQSQSDELSNRYSNTYFEHKAQRTITFDNVPENPLSGQWMHTKTSEDELMSIKSETGDNDIEHLSTDGIETCMNSRDEVIDFKDDLEKCSSASEFVERNPKNTQQPKQPSELGFNQSYSARSFENVAIFQADEDESFLTSILPSLRDMSVDEKLEFRIAVLQKISDIRAKRHKL